MPVVKSESEQWRDLMCLPDGGSPLEICRRFEMLAVALAPIELERFYCLPTSALPPQFTTASRHFGGWYNDSLHLWLKEFLPHYAGPAPACVVHDARTDQEAMAIAELARDIYRCDGEEVPLPELLGFLPDRGAIDRLCGVLTHELGHGLHSVASGQFAEWQDMFDGPPADTVFRRMVARKEVEAEPPAIQVDWHDLQFTRIVAHLDSRLRTVGVRSTKLDCAGDRYRQRPYAECYAALADELVRCSGRTFRPFAEILSAPMPPAFAACAIAPGDPT